MPEQDPQDLDTGYYVYAVVPVSGASDHAHEELRGIDETAITFVQYGDIAAAVNQIALDRPRGRRTDLLAHSKVVEFLAGQGAAVPVQFGSIMASTSEVEDELLAPRHDQFVGLLERLEGTAQFNLRATYDEGQVLGEVVRDNPVIADLHHRTRHLAEGEVHPDLVRLGEYVSQALEVKRIEDTDTLMASVLPLVVAVRERPGAGVDHTFDIAMLVELIRRDEFEETLETLAEAVHERIHLALTGPLPAYDFVEDASWA